MAVVRPESVKTIVRRAPAEKSFNFLGDFAQDGERHRVTQLVVNGVHRRGRTASGARQPSGREKGSTRLLAG